MGMFIVHCSPPICKTRIFNIYMYINLTSLLEHSILYNIANISPKVVKVVRCGACMVIFASKITIHKVT